MSLKTVTVEPVGPNFPKLGNKDITVSTWITACQTHCSRYDYALDFFFGESESGVPSKIAVNSIWQVKSLKDDFILKCKFNPAAWGALPAQQTQRRTSTLTPGQHSPDANKTSDPTRRGSASSTDLSFDTDHDQNRETSDRKTSPGVNAEETSTSSGGTPSFVSARTLYSDSRRTDTISMAQLHVSELPQRLFRKERTRARLLPDMFLSPNNQRMYAHIQDHFCVERFDTNNIMHQHYQQRYVFW